MKQNQTLSFSSKIEITKEVYRHFITAINQISEYSFTKDDVGNDVIIHVTNDETWFHHRMKKIKGKERSMTFHIFKFKIGVKKVSCIEYKKEIKAYSYKCDLIEDFF